MTAITTWQLSLSGIGNVCVYGNDFYYAGGCLAAGFGPDGPADLAITDLGGGNIALSTTLTDQDGNSHTYYLNSHYGTSYDGNNNGGMLLWFDAYGQPQYSSDSIGSEQTFRLFNLGGGYVALQAAGGAFPGQYLSGMANGWYPTELSMGTGSFVADGAQHGFQVNGPQLPILVITRSGFGLDLAGQSLAGLDLTGADMRRCNLTRADMSKITGLQGANFTDAGLCGADLAGQSLAGATWTGADFTGTDLSTVAGGVGADLSGAILTGARLAGVDLSGATLAGASLTNAWLAGANLSGATLIGASLAGAVLHSADLSGADLSGADLTTTSLAEADLTGAKLGGAKLSGLDLRQTALTRADLTYADLSGCNLAGVDLTGANLTGANFTKCNPAGMKLGGNTLTGTIFSGLDLTTVQFVAPLGQSTDPDRPTIFANATLPFAAMGLNWSCLDLTGATITGMPMDLANLNAHGLRRPDASFANATLDGANFAQATLGNAVFSGAGLSGANFDGADLTGSAFTRAKLDGASFVGAALGGVSGDQAAVFSSAYVANCDFSQANLFGVSFAGATLVGGNKLSGSANLQETDFSGAYLPDADFTGAVLQGAKFDSAFMVGCVLANVDLSPTRDGSVPSSLTSACLQAADFQGADLAGADLSNAAITDTAGSIPMQYYDETGQLTPPFSLPYPAGAFPASSSFGAQTVCPNGYTYLTNQQNGLSLARMMAAINPPTSWSPPGQATRAEGRAPAQAGR